MGSKRDKRKKSEKKIQNNIKNREAKELTKREIAQGLEKIFDIDKLKAPPRINDDIIKLSKSISDFEPIFIQTEPEPWSRHAHSDFNVNEYIKLNQGKMLCGYKVWYNKAKYIELERYAVWFKDGVYKDLTFQTNGEERILFIPDIIEKQNALEDNKAKIRWGKDTTTRQLIRYYERAEKLKPLEPIDNEKSWNEMQTHEAWQKAKTVSNFL